MSEKDFDKGYKSGFQFGKEVANEEWMNRIKQAREEMTAYIEPTTGQWTSGFNNGANTCIEILDKLITESERANEKL